MKTEVIYTVTGIPYTGCGGHRNFGWYPKFERAEQAVYANQGCLDEAGYYEWIVIEEIPQGVWAGCNRGMEAWYHWNKNKYVKTEKPEIFRGMVAWGMG